VWGNVEKEVKSTYASQLLVNSTSVCVVGTGHLGQIAPVCPSPSRHKRFLGQSEHLLILLLSCTSRFKVVVSLGFYLSRDTQTTSSRLSVITSYMVQSLEKTRSPQPRQNLKPSKQRHLQSLEEQRSHQIG
jgi:hypothetical protein